MPVQFVCPQCQKVLSVGSRKVGCQVQCPKCATCVVVPTAEEAAASVAVARAARERLSVLEVPISELLVHESPADGIPSLQFAESAPVSAQVVSCQTMQATPGPVVPAARSGPVMDALTPRIASPAIDLPTSPSSPESLSRLANPGLDTFSFDTPRPALPLLARPPGREMIMISRATLYMQALLFCLIAGVAFAVGYAAGRGSETATATPNEPPHSAVVDGTRTSPLGSRL